MKRYKQIIWGIIRYLFVCRKTLAKELANQNLSAGNVKYFRFKNNNNNTVIEIKICE